MVKRIEDMMQATRQLYEAMYRFDSIAARELDIHISDLRCVNALEKGPLSPGKIGQRLALTSGSVTTMLDRLEAKGFVRRVTNSDDQRRISVELEPIFYAEAATIYGALGRALYQQFNHLSDGEIEVAHQNLSALTEGFEQALTFR